MSKYFAFVPSTAGDALAVKVFQERDGVLARKPARYLFKGRDIHSGVYRLLRADPRLQILERIRVKDHIAYAKNSPFGRKSL